MSMEGNNMSEQQTSLFNQLSHFFTFDFTIESLINNFHFIRPLWLLAFIALMVVLFLLKKIRYYQSPWQHFLPPHLANALLENADGASNSSTTEITSSSQSRYWLKPLIIGSCIIIALAGPAWQKLPQPVYQLERGSVLIMDMSYSMYATDVSPNRLTRARYKAIDLLKKINEGDVGLIAYAGDAFIISPLTQDVKNIELLLPSLSPDIMPVHGSNALAALTLADQTLKNAGHISGDIYWFADDIENEEMRDVYNWANDNNHKLNILGVGSKVGAPIKLSNGKLLKDNSGAIVIPKLPEGRLSAISSRSRGIYHTMTNDDSDIKALTAHLAADLDDNLDLNASQSTQEKDSEQALQGDKYQEQGPWLLLIVLPLILSYFRRGSSILSIAWLMPLTFIFSLVSISPVSYAAQTNATSTNSASDKTAVATQAATANENYSASQLWRDLWQTSDQQGQQHYRQEEYQQAANQFEDSQWQGSAHYKAGEYQQALDAFKQSDNAQALYNQGNALAQLQQLDEAIDAYKEALAKDPNLSDAQDNLEQLEALKKQQQEQSQQSQDGDKNSEDQQGDQQKQDSEQESKDQSQADKQEGEQEQGEQQQGEQQESNEEQQQNEAEQKQQDSEKSQEQKEQEEQARQAEESKEQQETDEEKTLAQQASDSKAQETQQKHQQLLNKVTDDPYLLLRNKMRLEYQKRRNEGAPRGETKKW